MFSLADAPKSMLYKTITKDAENNLPKTAKLHPYDILFRYTELLGLKESTLRAVLKDEDMIADLLDLRKYLEGLNVDITLLRRGLPYITPYVDRTDDTDFLSLHLSDVTSAESALSSRAFLKKILPEDDPVYRVFAMGNSMQDVLAWQKELKASFEEKSGQEAEAEPTDHVEETEEEIPHSAEKDMKALFPETDAPRDFRQLAETYRKLRLKLQDAVKGQADAVQEFVQGVFQADVLHEETNRKLPAAVFLFVGPPGVGKTLMAQTAAAELGLPVKTFNMSEYATPNTAEDLIGTSAVYNNSKEGRLPEFVRKNPHSILIFDEIEKASRIVIQQFLQILDLGIMDNISREETVSFADTIIIFTSNACSSIYDNNYGNISVTPKHVILDALRNEEDPVTGVKKFPASICSRIAGGNIILFNHLGLHILTEMAEEQFEAAASEISKEYGFAVSLDKRLPLLFILQHGALTDARVVTRQSTKFLKNELFEVARQVESHKDLMDGISELSFELSLPSVMTEQPAAREASQIRELFENNEGTEIAVLCDKKNETLFALPNRFHIHFAQTPEELAGCLKTHEITMILIDPLCGIEGKESLGISLDDSYATGVRTFQDRMRKGGSTPVYLLETETPLNPTDRNSFLRMGASGVISALGRSPEEFREEIQQAVEEFYMEEKGGDFARRGYVLDFNTAQIPDKKTLRIRYHDIRRVQALDSSDAGHFLRDEERPEVRFDDVIGAENAKEELRSFIKYLARPAKYASEGKKAPKGILLYGPPGTGKTMLARAMAGESDAAFIQTSASAFLNKYVGQSEENVRELFRKARRYAPAVIFIDEIDAIGKERNGQGSTGVTESVLNTLLTEMDGFQTDARHPVFVLAATNYSIEQDESGKRALDPALVRRFDNRIYVDLPKESEREMFLARAVAKKFAQISAADIHNLAARTTGMSIAVLQNVVALAVRNAEKENRPPEARDLMTALEEYNFGEKKTFSREYYESVAIHESGHAYIAWKSGERPSYITIESRGNFGGYMQSESAEEKPRFTKTEMIWRIRRALGGRAAEEVFFGKEHALNTGASSDLQHATTTALRMFCSYGMMEDELIALPFETIMTTPLAEKYVAGANSLLRQEMEETIRLIEEGKEDVRRLADRLLAQNRLTEREITEVLSKGNGNEPSGGR